MGFVVASMNRSKAAAIGLGAAGVVASLVAFRAFDRPDEGPKQAVVDTARTPAETVPASVETHDLVARAAPAEPTERQPEPPLAPARRVVTPAPAPAQPEDRAPPDDVAILTKLHDLAASDPEQSLQLSREALERFPRSANASEFEWNVVKALFNMGHLEDAKDEARTMVRNYPDSDFSGDVERHLLNPQPNQ